MNFETNNTERIVTFSSIGKVGIGTSYYPVQMDILLEDFVIKSGASADDGVGL